MPCAVTGATGCLHVLRNVIRDCVLSSYYRQPMMIVVAGLFAIAMK